MKHLNKSFWTCLFLHLVLVSASLFAQKIRIYTTDDGLQQSSVTQCLQDSKGFMWFTTGEGLSRFDGIKFKNYVFNQNDTTSISNNSIRRMAEDDDGNLWIGSDNGINLYQRDRETFIRFNLNNNQAIHVISYKNNNLICYKTSTGSVVKYTIKSRSEKVLYTGNNEDRFLQFGDNLFAKEANALVKINTGTSEVNHYYFNKKIKTSETLLTIHPLGSRKIILFTNHGNYIFDIKTSSFSKTKIFENEQISDIFEDSKSNLWVGLNHKCILQLRPDLSVIDSFLIPQNFNNSSFYKFYEDKSGNIWIGLEGVGVCKLNPDFIKFKSQSPLSNGLKTADASNFVWSLLKSGDFLYIGTESNGLCIQNQLTTKIEHFNHYKNEKIKRVKSITQSSDGTIWIGTDKGLFVKSSRSESIKKIQNPLLNAKNINGLCNISETECIISCTDVCYLFNQETLEAIPIFSLRNFGAKYTYLDKEGNLWLQSFDLGIYFIRNFKSRHYPIAVTQLERFWNHAKIQCVFESKNGIFWVGTNQGLWQIEGKKILKTYGIKDGFPDEIINGILEDEASNLWISTNRGLCEFNPRNKTLFNYGTIDGLQSNEFNTGAKFKDSANILYFGGVNGYTSFIPSQIKRNKVCPKVEITEIKVMGNIISLTQVNNSDKSLELSYFNNSISLELASLEFTYPEKNKLAYSIEEINTNYEILNNTNYLNFTSLKPGRYTIWIKSCNSDGVWSKPIHIITLSITPPFYQTLWFLLASGLAFICIIIYPFYYFQRKRFRKKLIELEKQKELEIIKSRLAKDLHDELGSGLTKINFLAEFGNLETEIKAQNRLQTIKGLTQDLAEKMRELIWVMNPQNNHIDVLIARLREYSNDYLEEFPLDLEINFPEQTYDFELNYEASRNIFMALKEILQNIVKHAKADKVKVQLTITTEFLLCIHDNGCGFNNKEAKKGNGLINIQNRINSLGGSVCIISEEKKGLALRF